MADAFGGSRIQVKAPERGIFPLDHDGECKNQMKLFLTCLKDNNSDHFPCRDMSAKYLKCRMDKNLMKEEGLDTLGLGENPNYERKQNTSGDKEKSGFVAGTGVKASHKWLFW